MPGSAQRRLAQPSSGGFTPRSGDAVPRRGRAEVAGAVHTQGAALPSDDQSSAHAHAAHTPACPVRTPRSQALTHARMHTPGTVLPTHAEGSFPPAPPAPLALPGQQREVHLQPSAPKPAGRDCRGPAPFPSPGLRSRTPALRSPAWLTVKMLERRLDCLRMGVGVLEAAMVSIRSSRWLMLGVEGTEEE